MLDSFNLPLFALVVLVYVAVTVGPLQLAALLAGARRRSFGWCLVATTLGSFFHVGGLYTPIVGSVIAFFSSGLAYAAILDSSFGRGLLMAFGQIVFAAALFAVLWWLGLDEVFRTWSTR
ncbi:MAG: hypothetical protein U5L04_12560 [Trueperaceae bacterium]|nr:hypothetical protein [Trueperaceae bacterium]